MTENLDYIVSPIEPCILKKHHNKDVITYCGVYVDDLYFIGVQEYIQKDLNRLKEHFEITVDWTFTEYVGCQLIKTDSQIILHQSRLIDKMERYFLVTLTSVG